MFSVVAKKSRTFFQSPIQLMSRGAGAGKKHRQAASRSWPMEIFHTTRYAQFINGGWPGGQVSSIFSVSLNFFHEFRKNLQVPQLLLGHCLCNQSSGGEKKIALCIACFTHYYHYYYYTFLCCLIKLSFSQPTSFTFCPFSSPPHRRGRSK